MLWTVSLACVSQHPHAWCVCVHRELISPLRFYRSIKARSQYIQPPRPRQHRCNRAVRAVNTPTASTSSAGQLLAAGGSHALRDLKLDRNTRRSFQGKAKSQESASLGSVVLKY